ncbi:MAG: TatD family nuclease-associated radical SAM protein [Candidatus Bathyarchaeia archaeon]
MSAVKMDENIVYWLGENLYLNITNQCSNNCYFCIRNFKGGVGGFNLKLQRDPHLNEILGELQRVINTRFWKEIIFCGFGEPLMRLDVVLEVSRWIRSNYGKMVNIRVDTNGHGDLLNPKRNVVEELKKAGVGKVSISLNAHDKTSYIQVCRPKFENAFESVLDFIRKAKETLDVEITAVRVPEVDILKVEEIAEKLNVKFRVREYIQPFW